MTVHIGYMVIYTEADAVKYDDVTEVTGALYINAKATLPALTTVGGLYIDAKATLPALTTVAGLLWVCAEVTLPALTSVGGELRGIAKASLPALTSVGGSLYSNAEATLPALTTAHGVPGRLLCVSDYGLWLGDNGLLYAGCRKGLTVQQALEHWEHREDARAVLFTEAIKQIESTK
jgi:hypothetical protein